MPEAVSPPSSPEARAPDATSSDPFLAAAARRGAVVIVVLVVVLNLVAEFFELHLVRFSTWVFDLVGLPGLLAIAGLIDVLPSPVPPEVVLVLVANTEHAASWGLIAMAFGLVSSAAGCLDYGLGRLVAGTRWSGRVLGGIPPESKAALDRWGPWAVAIGAVTPVPYSMTCWAAGWFGFDFRRVAPMTLLRIPRMAASWAIVLWSM